MLVCARHKVPMRPAPGKTRRHWVPNELPWWTFHTCTLYEFPGRGLLEGCTWFSLIFTQKPFSFADLALSPFTVINHSHEYPYILSPSKSLNQG